MNILRDIHMRNVQSHKDYQSWQELAEQRRFEDIPTHVAIGTGDKGILNNINPQYYFQYEGVKWIQEIKIIPTKY